MNRMINLEVMESKVDFQNILKKLVTFNVMGLPVNKVYNQVKKLLISTSFD